MQALQEQAHGRGHDYRAGSPHLKHWALYDRFVSLLRDEVAQVSARGLPLTLLEVGAGHGGYTGPALALGCSVTATEMSRPSLAHVDAMYGLNPRFTSLFDADGSLGVLGRQRFSLVLCASVLHHIPDYAGFLREITSEHLTPGGALISIQDPLWYADLAPTDRILSKAAYLSWRASRGDYAQGLHTALRRLRGVYDETNPLDMVEYHVVRAGVDHTGIATELKPRFGNVSVVCYWSTQSSMWQRLGERLGATNTFALLATDFQGGLPA